MSSHTQARGRRAGSDFAASLPDSWRAQIAGLVRMAQGLSDATLADPEGSAGTSRLTPSGKAAELALVWSTADFRVSFDPCPAGSPSDRLRICAGATAPLLSRAQASVLDRVQGWQADHGARFGAWLGLRHRAGGIVRKLYLDVPPQAPSASWDEALTGCARLKSARGAAATMVGLDPLSGAIEVYYRCASMMVRDVEALLGGLEIRSDARAVARFAADLTRRSIRFALPSYDMGFSIALNAQGIPAALTWYSTAEGVLGPDERSHEALCRVGSDRGWDMGAYLGLCAGARPSPVLFGAALAADQTPAFSATLAFDLADLERRTRGAADD